ncbi:hypothetical protein MKJ04_20575 [Pontibacter sp. E15-1]|uniref:hypothetical protein n=1 Tax=Pontibacter sp. E15-1 TaxID=2919918 RepID=UPI001F4F72B5|nr:hypothetical protein [Pontibacter sp. E15-1]MCJ8167248.1 hypothetical protein [Pontibacter sp. E15-1]
MTDYEDLIAAWPAPLQLVHAEGDLFVTLLQQPNYIEAKWIGHITAGDVVTTANIYLALMQKTPMARLLNDKTEVSGDWTDANDWLQYEWLPKAVEAGLCAMAHVYSSNMFSRLSARDLYMRLIPNLYIENFNDQKAAINWLLSCNC